MRNHLSLQAAFAVLLGTIAGAANGQPVRQGDVVRDFTVVNRATGRTLRLSDFAGRVIVLDFFAYWCGPCRSASADLESNIGRYYAERTGDPGRPPVVVVGINIEPSHPERTDDFVRRVGLELAADDVYHVAFGMFDEKNTIPLVVVINGMADAEGRKQWELMYRKAGYEGAAALRLLINSIRTSRSLPGGPSR